MVYHALMDDYDFIPALWLKNPHAQTIWPVLAASKVHIALKKQKIELPDGDFIELVWDAANADQSDKPIVLILHGLGGDINSAYAKSFMNSFSKSNWRPVFMHFRGAGEECNRLDRAYHSGDTEDVAYIVNLLSKQCDEIAAVGVSLGGNVLLKWLGQTGDRNPLKAAVAISVPFELRPSVDHMSTGFSRAYQRWLLRSLRYYINRKFENRPAPFDMQLANTARSFWEYDNVVTAPLHGFKDADQYYAESSSRQYLPGITVPTLIIHAKDDPFVPTQAIPSFEEVSSSTTLQITDYGGHVGFISSKGYFKTENWLDKRIPAYLREFLTHSK